MTKTTIKSADMKHSASAWIYVTMIIAIPILAGCSDDHNSATAPVDTASSSPVAPPSLDAFGVPDGFRPAITPDSNEDCTVGAATCWRYSVVVPKGMSKPVLEQNMRYCVEQAYNDHHAVRGVVNAYAAGTDLNGMYSAANVLWGSEAGGDDPDTDADTVAKTIRIEDSGDYFKAERVPARTIAGRSEAQRKKIAYEIALAEDRATHEADTALPTTSGDTSASADQASRNVMPNIDLNRKLEERYHNQIKRRYHLSDKQFEDIIGESGEKHWPTPNPSKD